MRKLCIFSLAVMSIFITNTALAQIDPGSLTDPELSIDIQPEFPRPGEEVTATLNDYRGGVYGATVTWIFNGDVVPDAENRRTTTFTAGPTGSTQEIRVILSRPQGGSEVLTRTIRPMYLDVVIEPQTRTPDFYDGRSLPSTGSIVNATAIVSMGTGIRNTDLVYTWRLNRSALEGGPVRGLNQVTFEMPMGNSQILSLQVTEPNGTVLARRSFFIPSVTPEIHFYEVSPLLGIKTNTLQNRFNLIGNSSTIKAEPYHLDTRVYNDPDMTEWQVNGQPTNGSNANPYEVTIQRTGNPGGSSLNFHVRDLTQVLQGAERTIQINY